MDREKLDAAIGRFIDATNKARDALVDEIRWQTCDHRETKEGPRIPASWGTTSTEVCVTCGSWRTFMDVYAKSPWRTTSLKEAMRKNEQT